MLPYASSSNGGFHALEINATLLSQAAPLSATPRVYSQFSLSMQCEEEIPLLLIWRHMMWGLITKAPNCNSQHLPNEEGLVTEDQQLSWVGFVMS